VSEIPHIRFDGAALRSVTSPAIQYVALLQGYAFAGTDIV